MDIKPIPVPAQGTTLDWQLDQPYRAKHLLLLLLVLAVLLFTGHRTEMDKMVVMTGQAVGNLVGLADDSQVVRGLSRVGASMWPPAFGTEEEVARLTDLDRDQLPFLAKIETREKVEQHLNPDTLEMETSSEKVELLIKPLGYAWTVFIKMLETIEIAIWGTLFSVVLSIPL
ncbi:MAG: hypothetical protein Q8Q57_09030, partial [Methylotenera sp.]|nr:hypothetical protein [Methylotenera sp.]